MDELTAASQLGSVVITIQADGESVFGEAVTWESGARAIDLSITGKQTLDLTVSGTDDGIDGDAVS